MEKIVAVIEDESRGPPSMKGMGAGPLIFRTGSEKARYDVYFTDKRIIAAVVFSTSDLSKLMGIAGFQSVFKFKKIRKQRREELQGKTPDEILRMHPESFEVPYEKIQSVKVKKGLFGAKLEIEALWKDEVGKFGVPIPKKRVGEIKDILNLYLSGKVVE
jgi:putative transposon-encoded protein